MEDLIPLIPGEYSKAANSRMKIQFLFVVLLLGLCQQVSSQQFGSKAPKASADRRDLPLVSCSVCTSLAYILYDFVSQAHNEVAEANKQRKLLKSRNTGTKIKLDETVVMDVLDGICTPENVHGEWLRHLDIIEIDGERPVKAPAGEYKKLVLEWHDAESKCGAECQTLALSCSTLLQDEVDVDELQALLYSFNLSRDDIQARICKKMSKRCRKDDKSYLMGTIARSDEKYVEMSEKDVEMEKLMEQMKSMGMGGSAYAREDLDSLAASMADGYADGEEEEKEKGEWGMPNIGGFDGSFGSGGGERLGEL